MNFYYWFNLNMLFLECLEKSVNFACLFQWWKLFTPFLLNHTASATKYFTSSNFSKIFNFFGIIPLASHPISTKVFTHSYSSQSHHWLVHHMRHWERKLLSKYSTYSSGPTFLGPDTHFKLWCQLPTTPSVTVNNADSC